MRHLIDGVEITSEQVSEFKQSGFVVRCFATPLAAVPASTRGEAGQAKPARKSTFGKKSPKLFPRSMKVRVGRDAEKRLQQLAKTTLTDKQVKMMENILLVYDNRFSKSGFAIKGELTKAVQAFVGGDPRKNSVTSGMSMAMRLGGILEVVTK